MNDTQAQDDGRTDVRGVRTADGYVLDDVERAAYEALMWRLAWPSMHWGVEGVSAEAWPHLAIAAAVGARTALAAVSAAAPEGDRLLDLSHAVAEAYLPAGQAIWWRSWLMHPERRSAMEAGVLGAWSGEAAPASPIDTPDRHQAAAAPAYEVVLDRTTGEVTRQAPATPDELALRERLAREEANAEIEGEPLTDNERASILAGRCGPLLYGGPCWLLPGHRTPAHLCYREDADALIAAALAARPAPVVSGAEWQRIVDRVASQRFTDDDGNDAGTMHSGHAVMAVTLTLDALGVTYRTVADAPAAESPFFRDLTTGEPCPRSGPVLCTITDRDHLHKAIHMDAPAAEVRTTPYASSTRPWWADPAPAADEEGGQER